MLLTSAAALATAYCSGDGWRDVRVLSYNGGWWLIRRIANRPSDHGAGFLVVMAQIAVHRLLAHLSHVFLGLELSGRIARDEGETSWRLHFGRAFGRARVSHCCKMVISIKNRHNRVRLIRMAAGASSAVMLGLKNEQCSSHFVLPMSS